MSISTFSSFYYGFSIDETNNFIPFDEGGAEINAEIDIGAYSLTDVLVKLKTAMDAVGGQTYTWSVDRDTRLVTVSAASNFSLLIGTGSTRGTSPFELLGFTGGVDLTGSNSYTGDSPAGSEYLPQFILQDYNSPEEFQERIGASVNESANGEIEVISFGLRKFIEMNIMYINNRPQDGTVIKTNLSGVSDAIHFMEFITQKFPFEFIPDVADRNTFHKVLLESTPQSREGVGFKLRELVGRGLPGYYETGVLRLRVLD